jgi:peptidoglycan/LPS O-acetylase OafA/YrhL
MSKQAFRFEYLDGIRGLLAVFVALSHIYGALTGYAPGRPFEGAYLAVDMFFVMSGFVLAKSLEFQKEKWIFFFLKRLARLWPLHFLGVVLVLVVLHFNELRNQYVPDYWSYLNVNSIIKNIFFLENIGLSKDVLINDPSWSISIEFWVGVSLLYFFQKFNLKWSALLISLASYYVVVNKFGGSLAANQNIYDGVNAGLLRGIGGIALGLFLSNCNLTQRGGRLTQELAAWLGFLFVIFCICNNGFYWDLVVVLVFSLLVLLLKDQHLLISSFLSASFLTWLGEISF